MRSDACAVAPARVTPRSQRDRLQQCRCKTPARTKTDPAKYGGVPPLPSQPVVLFFIRAFVSVAVATVVFFSSPLSTNRKWKGHVFSDCAVQSFPFKDVKWKRQPSSGDFESGLCAICRDVELNADGKTCFWRIVERGKHAGSVRWLVLLTATSVLTGSSQKHILSARTATVKGITESHIWIFY